MFHQCLQISTNLELSGDLSKTWVSIWFFQVKNSLFHNRSELIHRPPVGHRQGRTERGRRLFLADRLFIPVRGEVHALSRDEGSPKPTRTDRTSCKTLSSRLPRHWSHGARKPFKILPTIDLRTCADSRPHLTPSYRFVCWPGGEPQGKASWSSR